MAHSSPITASACLTRSCHSRIPTGFRPKAQGCEERATLGKRPKKITTPTGFWPTSPARQTKTEWPQPRCGWEIYFTMKEFKRVSSLWLKERGRDYADFYVSQSNLEPVNLPAGFGASLAQRRLETLPSRLCFADQISPVAVIQHLINRPWCSPLNLRAMPVEGRVSL